jgi:hypothetical protein
VAIPPQPLEQVLPQAAWVFEGVVTEVLATGPDPAAVDAAPGTTSAGHKVAAQTVKLKVTRLLRGKSVEELVAEKPVAGYALKPGDKGPFLVDASGAILGRYGPDSYALSQIEAAL